MPRANYDGSMQSFHGDVRLKINVASRTGCKPMFYDRDRARMVRIQAVKRQGRTIQFVESGIGGWKELPIGVTVSWSQPRFIEQRVPRGHRQFARTTTY